MQRFAKRGLVWMLAVALVVAGLPMAHAMPDAPVLSHTTMHHHADMAAAEHVHHHHDGMTMMDTVPDRDDGDQSAAGGPCKCLNCSMCVASFVASPMRFATPERRILAVTYAMAPGGIPGIATRVDPGIPILAV